MPIHIELGLLGKRTFIKQSHKYIITCYDKSCEELQCSIRENVREGCVVSLKLGMGGKVTCKLRLMEKEFR